MGFGVGHTHVGLRAHNEDAFHTDDRAGLYVVADGMGGYEGGEIASRLAVSTLTSFYDRVAPDAAGLDEELATDRMDLAFRLANREVTEHKRGDLMDMGTTLAALKLGRGRAVVAHVGDSRVYRLRDERLERLTVDHSLSAELGAIDGAMAIPMRISHLLTRAIGIPNASQADVIAVDVCEGDVFLLCTDGLTGVLDDERIAVTLRAFPADFACAALVGEALGAGTRDNVTAVVVRVG